MANRGPSYGLSLECKRKIEQKFDVQRARDVVGWMEAVLGRKLHPNDVSSLSSEQDFARILKNGVALCDLMNVISPGSVRPAKKSKLAFHQMENIELFTKACITYGMHPLDVFQVPDLFESKAMFSVLNCLHALGSLAQKKGFQGPSFGVKLSEKNERNFSEQQIIDGKKVIPMQAGSNLHPSQSGMTPYGQGRQIVPSDPGSAEPTISSGQSVISLQYGTNRHASQSGMTPYGLGRQILLSTASAGSSAASSNPSRSASVSLEAESRKSESESVNASDDLLLDDESTRNVRSSEDENKQEMNHQQVNGTFESDVFDESEGSILI